MKLSAKIRKLIRLKCVSSAAAKVVSVCVADEVPGSAVMLFDVELVDVEEGLPEGYMFIWNDDVSPDLFAEMDKNNNGEVEPSEVRDQLLF